MNGKKVAASAAAALAVAGAAVAVGVSNANADASTAQGGNGGYGGYGGYGAPPGEGRGGPGAPGGPGGARGSQDTPVTGDEAAKVTAAVVAKDSAVTVTSVRKDPDGSYDVLGTKAGQPVFFDVSADLATITQATGGPGHGGGPGGGHGPWGTEVTGDEAAKVTAAVTAKDSAVTVTSVRKGTDGSYHVLGTKAGARVLYTVSADLATVTLAPERQGPPPGAPSSAPTGAPTGAPRAPAPTGGATTG